MGHGNGWQVHELYTFCSVGPNKSVASKGGTIAGTVGGTVSSYTSRHSGSYTSRLRSSYSSMPTCRSKYKALHLNAIPCSAAQAASTFDAPHHNTLYSLCSSKDKLEFVVMKLFYLKIPLLDY